MRICLYSETALPKVGGQELVVDALARHLQRAGHEVTVLAARPRKRWFVNDAGLPYRVVRHWPLFSTHRLVGWYRHALLKLYREWRWDVLHCHSVFPCGYLAALSTREIPTPIVITSHGGDVREGNARLSKRGQQHRFELSVQRADALVSISRFTSDGFQRLGAHERQIVQIPNGVDLTPFQQPAPRPRNLDTAIEPHRYLLFLGRLHRRKGVDVALDALAQTPPRGGVELVIAGNGEERLALEAQATRLNVSDRVRFVGPVSGEFKTYLLQNARCLLLPSREWEAFPLVVLEAYAAGIPVIGTRIPGLSDLIEPGNSGWLVDPESPGPLANAIKEVLQTQDFRRMGWEVRNEAERFSWTVIAQRHVQLYQELVANRSQLRAA